MNTNISTPLKSYAVELETLSPLTIGAGKEATLSPYTDFVIDKGQVHILDHTALSNELGKHPEFIDEFVRGVRSRMDNNRSDFDLRYFIAAVLKCPLKNLTSRTLRAGAYKGKVELQRCISTRDKPYIPGSSIKGAFRTAVLLDWLITGKNSQKTRDKVVELAIKGISRELKKCRIQEACFGTIANDRFRYLHIGDSATFSTDSLEVMERSRFFLKSGEKDTQKNAPVMTEALKPGIRTTFSLRIPEYTPDVDSQEQDAGDRDRYFNFLYKRDVLRLLQIVNNYARKNIDRELAILDRQKASAPYDFYTELKNTMVASLESNEAILRIGAGKTYFDNSIGLMFDEAKGSDREQLRKLITAISPKHAGLNSSRVFPSTRSFSAVDDKPSLPYGWVKLKLIK